jgi:dTDP-4-amino-4,6-dideoxygalactose transaminase
MHLQPVFAFAPFGGTSEHLFNEGLCLPSGNSLTDEEIVYVAERVKNILNDKIKFAGRTDKNR